MHASGFRTGSSLNHLPQFDSLQTEVNATKFFKNEGQLHWFGEEY